MSSEQAQYLNNTVSATAGADRKHADAWKDSPQTLDAKDAGETPPPIESTSGGSHRPPATTWELNRLLLDWSRQGMPFPRQRTVVDFFQDQVRQRPKGPAVSDVAKVLDFATLDRLSNRVANRLLRSGLKPEGIVALPMNRSCAYVIAALGVLKAGGAYLPLDLLQPDERLQMLLTDSQTSWAIIAPEHTNRFANWGGELILLDNSASSLDLESDAPVQVASGPNQLAYVIYTSGSTGQPKGVEIEHHSLTNLVCFYHRWLSFSELDRVPLIANVAFDASVADLWPCLCAGGTILIPPNQLSSDIDGLIHWLTIEHITFAFVPTALAELMLTRPWPAKMSLRFLGTGGEALHVRPPASLPFRVINQYGPTENTVDSTWAIVSPGAETDRPPIGMAIGNVATYVLDENQKPVKAGSEGELYLGGEQVARGYLNRPALTQKRFLPDPFSNQAQARMYRTGDWVRLEPDGNLQFIGRRDNQVQIRGRRVELAEIEHQLRLHPAVSQALCEPLMDGDSVYGIAAHVASAQNERDLLAILQKYCAEKLPAYMVPRNFSFYAQMPVNSRGKLDRTALRQPAPAVLPPFAATLPEESMERALAELWYQLLPGARDADVSAPFDSVGGDSMHAVKLMLGAEEIVGRRIPLSTFLIDPTLPGFLRMAAHSPPATTSCVIPLRKEGQKPPVFCLYGVHGDIYHYFELSKAFDEDQPVFGIRTKGLEDLSKLPQSMEEAGSLALRWIRETTPHCPPLLVGYSWGGLLAFEVARQWFKAEGVAPVVAMLGSTAPRRRTTAAYRVWHFFRWLPHWVAIKLKAGFVRSPAQMLRRLGAYFAKDPVLKSTEPGSEWDHSPIAQHFLRVEDQYQPDEKVPVEIHLFRETCHTGNPGCHPLESSYTDHETDHGWKHWSKLPVKVHWIEADHDSIIRPPAVKQVAEEMRALIKNRCTTFLMGCPGLAELSQCSGML